MSKKISYRVQNWKAYNRALINRGNITLWFSDSAIKHWYQPSPNHKQRGRPKTYSDSYIELALTLRSLFHLSLRATQGFMEGLVSLMGLDLKVSNYTRFSRRAAELNIELPSSKMMGNNSIDIVVDSTGLKIYGEGEWKMRTHGKQKRRTWRKYHVAVDPSTHCILAMKLTLSNVHDCTVLPALLANQKNVGKVYADGAYTFKKGFDAIAEVGGQPVIPIRSGTWLVDKNPSDGECLRNQLVLDILNAGGKNDWKKSTDYHRRSLVETHMMRLKTIFGNSLKSRRFDNQIIEANLIAKLLNQMTALGMPISHKMI